MTKKKRKHTKGLVDLSYIINYATNELPKGWEVRLCLTNGNAIVRLFYGDGEVAIITTESSALGIMSDAVRDAQKLSMTDDNSFNRPPRIHPTTGPKGEFEPWRS